MTTVLLLHGAIGAPDQMLPIASEFSSSYDVRTFCFSGHGDKHTDGSVFSIQYFANEVRDFITQNNLEQVHIFGYSMGGYVALYLSLHYPHLVSKVATLATKFHWDAATAAQEIRMLNPDKIEQKLPAFAATLQERHSGVGWREVLSNTATMMVGLGEHNAIKIEEYSSIYQPVLLLLGDRDKMVSVDETMGVCRTLPNSNLGLLPNTNHPIEQVDAKLLHQIIADFFQA